jgi:hypothetical protein
VADLGRSAKLMTPSEIDTRKPHLKFRDLLGFMPEGLGAIVVAVWAPIYGVALIRKGFLLPALGLAVGLCVIAFMAFRGFRRHSKVVVYLAILGALGLWFAINSWVGLL